MEQTQSAVVESSHEHGFVRQMFDAFGEIAAIWVILILGGLSALIYQAFWNGSVVAAITLAIILLFALGINLLFTFYRLKRQREES